MEEDRERLDGSLLAQSASSRHHSGLSAMRGKPDRRRMKPEPPLVTHPTLTEMFALLCSTTYCLS
jgi:hypothetical protein